MPSSSPRLPVVLAVSVGAAVLLGALVWWSGRAPTAVQEWTPADHDQPPAQAQAAPAKPEDPVALAWAGRCASCHGDRGQGDGPQASVYGVVDLTRPDWLARVTDADIAETIKKGRNRMPAFDLPPGVLNGLVQRIRANGRKR